MLYNLLFTHIFAVPLHACCGWLLCSHQSVGARALWRDDNPLLSRPYLRTAKSASWSGAKGWGSDGWWNFELFHMRMILIVNLESAAKILLIFHIYKFWGICEIKWNKFGYMNFFSYLCTKLKFHMPKRTPEIEQLLVDVEEKWRKRIALAREQYIITHTR